MAHFQAIGKFLKVDKLNGINIHKDVLFRDQLTGQQVLHLHSSLFCARPMTLNDVKVALYVGGLAIPQDVIALHPSDVLQLNTNPLGLSFEDGITAATLTIQAGHLDKLTLGLAAETSASSLTRSLLIDFAKGRYLVRSPSYAKELTVKRQGPRRGLVNGIRIEELMPINSSTEPTFDMFGRKVFDPLYEVVDCQLSTFNHVHNWTNHMLRIDKFAGAYQVSSDLLFERFTQVNELDIPMTGHSNQINYERSPQFLIDCSPIKQPVMMEISIRSISIVTRWKSVLC